MIRTWTLGILCVLVTAFFVVYTITVQKTDTLLDARTHMVNSVHYLNMDIERTLYGLDQTFKGVQNYLSVFTRQHILPTDDDIQPILNDLFKENPFVRSFLVLDANGETDYWTGLGPRPDLRYTDYYSIHKNHKIDRLYIGRPVASKENHDSWTFGVSKGLRDGAGNLTSVMVAMIDLEYMKKRYQGLQIPSGASLTISSLDDYVYLHLPNHDGQVGKYVKGITPKVDIVNQTLVARFDSPIEKQTKYIASRKVSYYPLVVSIKESEATILAMWKKNAIHFICLGIAISFALLFMTLRVAGFQKKQQMIKEKLRDQATTDPLTGLANRRFVLEQSALEIRKAKRSKASISFVMMDLDHFKEVNDSYGHETGDKVLKETAAILQRVCREADIVSRYGGEEFLLVLPNTDLEGALSEAERIRMALAKTSHWCGNQQFVVTASFGVSQWLENEETCDPAVKRADDALYKVKKNGRNSIMSLPMAKVMPLRKKTQQNRS